MDEERTAQAHNEASGDGMTAVQAGSIRDVNIYNGPPPRQPADVPIAITCEVDANYLIERDWSDGIPLSGGVVRFYVESRADRAVLLRALRTIVVARRQPGSGTPTTRHGIPEVRRYELDLDADPPRLTGPKFLYTVDTSDPEVFEVEVTCQQHDVEWRFELDWICAGRTGTSVVDLGGHPFHFTGLPDGR